MTIPRDRNEGFRLLDEFVCRAIPDPSLGPSEQVASVPTEFDEYYGNMSSSDIMREFDELVAEWRRGTNDCRVRRALTAIWNEMNSRGTRLPSAPELGDIRRFGDW